jgi:hypothetical protein
LDTIGISDLRSSCLTMHVNKVHHVTTINRVAEDLGEDEDWLRDVANEMEIEDGLIWVYGVGEDGVMAFTDFGIETLMELIRIHKENPKLLRRRPACGLRRMNTTICRFQLDPGTSLVLHFQQIMQVLVQWPHPPESDGFGAVAQKVGSRT